MTAQSILLSIALQSSAQDYLLLFLFLIVAIIFFVIFYSWWRGVSEEDLDKIIEADAKQTSGPATFGEELPVPVQASEEIVAVEAETAVAEPVEVVEEPVEETH